MKKLVCLFLMLCLMAGCMRTSRHPQLVAVDSLLISQPDSALMLLRQQLPSFGGTEGGSSSSDRMYYYLLLADACNKCYDTLPSDSVMHLVADFCPMNRYAPTTSSAVSIVTSAKHPKPSTATTPPLTVPTLQARTVTIVCS